MSHEQAPKDREMQLRANKLLIDAHIPIFADIALTNSNAKEMAAMMHSPSISADVVVSAGDKFYDITFMRLYAGTPSVQDVITVEQLAYYTNSSDRSTVEYVARFDSKSRAITERKVVKYQSGEITYNEGQIDNPAFTQEFFKEFVEFKPDGTVVANYRVIEPKKAKKLLDKHKKFLDFEFGHGGSRERLSARARRVGTKALDDFGKSTGGFNTWH